MPVSRCRTVHFALVVVAMAHVTASAAAHGGVFRGPGSSVPPGGVPTAPATPTGGGPTGLGAALASDLSSWTVWWDHRRDPLLDLRAAIHGGGPSSRGDGFTLGRGERAAAVASLRPSAAVLRERVVPALLEALATQRNRDLRSACLIALARIGAPVAGRDLRAPLEMALSDPDQEVAETAALALGLLGDDGALPLLAGLLADAPRGRSLVGKGRVPVRTRAFAAYGIGLAAAEARREDVRRFAVSHLAAALRGERFASRDVPVACVLSLGLVPLTPPAAAAASLAPQPPSASRHAQVRFLLSLLVDGDGDPFVRAQAAGPIARLLEGAEDTQAGRALKLEAAQAFIAPLAPHARANRELRQGCVIAIGLLADGDQDEVDARMRAALVRTISDGQPLLRSLALISLAEAAARPGTGEEPLGALTEARAVLLRSLASGTSVGRPWAAFALALAERSLGDQAFAPSADVARALRAALREAASHEEAAAHCLALGLLGDPAALGPVRERFDELSVEDAKGYAAVALGMLGAPESAPALREVLERSRYRPALLRDAAVALALVGDRGAVPALVDQLRRAESLSAQAALSSALGQIGDSRAIDPLLELLADEEATGRARAFAAAALGQVGDRRALPWNAPIARLAVWSAAPATLSDPGSASGVLDLL